MVRRITYPRPFRWAVYALAFTIVMLNLVFPPSFDEMGDVSPVVTDKDGQWLAGFTVEDGTWRLPADISEIDPRFIERLIRIEDKRFWYHSGVDVAAIFRAAKSWARAGEPVSGASTLTMQLVRQLEPRPRNLRSKFVEIFRAVQLETRFSKTEILEAYLTHAPYGGNIEGVTAASLTYFDKPPEHLTDSEIALLIALPQAPEARRPDHRPKGAVKGRNIILDKLSDTGLISDVQNAEARDADIPSKRLSVPDMAWITAYGLAQNDRTVKTTLDARLQRRLETLTKRFVEPLDSPVNTAITIVENKTMSVRAHIASADRSRPGGWIDMTTRMRSPGSTLKPFIYGLAVDDGLITTGSFIKDMPTRFGKYRPENFNRRYHGDVRVYEALRHSLNVPAVAVMDQIGGQRFEDTLRNVGVDLTRLGNKSEAAGLALALGGTGMTVNDLAVLYAGLANGGLVSDLKWQDGTARSPIRILSETTSADITRVLRQAPTPEGHVPSWLTQNAPPIAYKTGTSYGFRDAWAAGYTDDWTVIVWVGRPDGAPRLGETGRIAAAPLLFDVFDILPKYGATHKYIKDSVAPDGLQRLGDSVANGPQILFPPDGAEIYAPKLGRDARGFTLSARADGGAAQFYVDGVKLAPQNGRTVWKPDAPGFYAVMAVDAAGRRAVSDIQVVTQAGL